MLFSRCGVSPVIELSVKDKKVGPVPTFLKVTTATFFFSVVVCCCSCVNFIKTKRCKQPLVYDFELKINKCPKMKSSSSITSEYRIFKMLALLLFRVKRYSKSITVIFLTYLVSVYLIVIIQMTSNDYIATLKSNWLFLSRKKVH